MLFDLICRANEKPTLTLIPCQKKKTTHILLIIVRNWNIAKLATRIYHPIHDKVKFRKIGKFKKANDVTGAFFHPPRVHVSILLFSYFQELISNLFFFPAAQVYYVTSGAVIWFSLTGWHLYQGALHG